MDDAKDMNDARDRKIVDHHQDEPDQRGRPRVAIDEIAPFDLDQSKQQRVS
jgi:hypothetical protein